MLKTVSYLNRPDVFTNCLSKYAYVRDPEFFNGGGATARSISTECRVRMIEYLQVGLLVLSNCILTVAYTNTVDTLYLYMNGFLSKYWYNGKYKALKVFLQVKMGGGQAW